MSEQDSTNPKVRILLENRSLHPTPELIQDELFLHHEFFDPHDIVQVKYEMVRRVLQDQWTVVRTTRVFGMSRLTFYAAQNALIRGGLPALVPRKRGRRQAHKLTPEVMRALEIFIAANPGVKVSELVDFVDQEFGFTVHRRSIERAFNRQGKDER